MNSDVSTIAQRVRDQARALPDLFGRFDFDRAPERWAPEADAASRVRSSIAWMPSTSSTGTTTGPSCAAMINMRGMTRPPPVPLPVVSQARAFRVQ